MKKPVQILTLLCVFIGSVTVAMADSLVVVPFCNAGDKDGEWVGTGIYENVIRNLQRSGIRLVSSKDINIACGYLGVYTETAVSDENIRKVAGLLDADRVAFTRYKAGGGRISITVELFRTRGWVSVKKIVIDDLSENIFSIQDAIAAGLKTDAPVEYVAPKPVFITVKKKKKVYSYKKDNPYLYPYEWYARGQMLKTKLPSSALNYLIQTLRYDPEHVGALCAAADITHNEQGHIDGALGYLLRADRILAKRGESSSLAYASLMMRIADIYEHKKDAVKSQVFLSRALEIWKKNKRKDPNEYAEFLCDVGAMYEEHGAGSAEIDYYSMAQQVFEKEGNSRSMRYAWLTKKMGDRYLKQQSLSAAESCYETASSALAAKGLDGTADYADCKLQLGLLYARKQLKVKADGELRCAQRVYSNLWQYDKARVAQKEADSIVRGIFRK